MNSRQFITSLYTVLVVGLCFGVGVLFLEAYSEYDRLKQTEAASVRRLAEVKARLEQQERILERLRTDRAYVERAIRLRLNNAKPDEMIFQFQD